MWEVAGGWLESLGQMFPVGNLLKWSDWSHPRWDKKVPESQCPYHWRPSSVLVEPDSWGVLLGSGVCVPGPRMHRASFIIQTPTVAVQQWLMAAHFWWQFGRESNFGPEAEVAQLGSWEAFSQHTLLIDFSLFQFAKTELWHAVAFFRGAYFYFPFIQQR